MTGDWIGPDTFRVSSNPFWDKETIFGVDMAFTNGSGIQNGSNQSYEDYQSARPRVGDCVRIVKSVGGMSRFIGVTGIIDGIGGAGDLVKSSWDQKGIWGSDDYWVPVDCVEVIRNGVAAAKKFFGKIDSDKLDSLPDDLKKIADEVLAEKFGT